MTRGEWNRLMNYSPINRFRSNRGRHLRKQIRAMARHLGRDLVVLDVGGRPDYWANVGLDHIARVEVLNYSSEELERGFPGDVPAEIFQCRIGDARNLSDYADKSVDFVHSNSVIEHVGGWTDMSAMASELMRVGQAGWVQTPAYEFPIEPHFRAPFVHWFGRPTRARLLSFLSARAPMRRMDLDRRCRKIEGINLLSRREVKHLFPGCRLYVERVILAKSYAARWVPSGVPLELAE
jgi:Methyltransferase domain